MDDKTIYCKLRLIGVNGCKLDSDNCIIFVEDISRPNIVLPSEIKGLRGTGFSGLDIESITINKGLDIFEISSLENCKQLKRIFLYESQLELFSELFTLYSDLEIKIRKGVC